MTLKSLFVLVIFSVDILPPVHGAGELDNFVTGMMSNYGDWLQSENLDPSTPTNLTMEIYSRNIILDIDIITHLSNQYALDYSKEIHLNSIQSDLDEGSIQVRFSSLQNVTFKGRYDVNGTVEYSHVEGPGNWFFTFSSVNVSVSYSGFTVTPNGFIDLSEATLSCNIFVDVRNLLNMEFDGVLMEGTGGVGGYVWSHILVGYIAQLHPICKQHPLIPPVNKYFMDIFNSTPLSEMLEATLPPTTTVTTPIPTTCGPCGCGGDERSAFFQPGGNIIDEVEISQDIKTDENGEEYIVTKKLITVKTKKQ